jgi:hypothetical protein
VKPGVEADDEGGWRKEEKRMVIELQNYCADHETPRNPADMERWRRGSFFLKATTRTQAVGKQGTKKILRCTGRPYTTGHGQIDPSQRRANKDKKCLCDFFISCEFVSEIDGGKQCGWVLKQVYGGQHELTGTDGKQHHLKTSMAEMMTERGASYAGAQLRSNAYVTLGNTLKQARLGTRIIDRALRQRAQELGEEPRWTMKHIQRHFGVAVKGELSKLHRQVIDAAEKADRKAAAQSSLGDDCPHPPSSLPSTPPPE